MILNFNFFIYEFSWTTWNIWSTYDLLFAKTKFWFLAVLNEDGAIVFGDIRPDRGSSDSWILQGRTSTILPLVRILIIK